MPVNYNLDDSYYNGQRGEDSPLNDRPRWKDMSGMEQFGYAANIGGQALSMGADVYRDVSGIKGIDVTAANPYQQYSVYNMPDPYVEQAAPEQIQRGTGLQSAMQYGSKGAQLGMTLGGPVGAVAGAGIGALAGAITGRQAKRKREAWERRQDELRGRYTDAMQRYQSYQAQQQMIPYFNQSIYGL